MRHGILLVGLCFGIALVAACGSSTENTEKSQAPVDAGPDPKIAECTEDAYRQAVSACAGGFVGDVNTINRCTGLEGAQDAFAAGKYGEAACLANESGLILKCVLEKAASCDGKTFSQQAETWVTCQTQVNPGFKAPEESCRTTCFTARTSCEDTCPAEAAKACFDCYSQCGLTLQQCLDDCPRTN